MNPENVFSLLKKDSKQMECCAKEGKSPVRGKKMRREKYIVLKYYGKLGTHPQRHKGHFSPIANKYREGNDMNPPEKEDERPEIQCLQAI